MNDLNDIVRKRNAKLAKKPTRRSRQSASFANAQLSEALGPAPRYVIDAVTRALAIGNSGR